MAYYTAYLLTRDLMQSAFVASVFNIQTKLLIYSDGGQSKVTTDVLFVYKLSNLLTYDFNLNNSNSSISLFVVISKKLLQIS